LNLTARFLAEANTTWGGAVDEGIAAVQFLCKKRNLCYGFQMEPTQATRAGRRVSRLGQAKETRMA
jgi:hypothetical protein